MIWKAIELSKQCGCEILYSCVMMGWPVIIVFTMIYLIWSISNSVSAPSDFRILKMAPRDRL